MILALDNSIRLNGAARTQPVPYDEDQNSSNLTQNSSVSESLSGGGVETARLSAGGEETARWVKSNVLGEISCHKRNNLYSQIV